MHEPSAIAGQSPSTDITLNHKNNTKRPFTKIPLFTTSVACAHYFL